MFKEVLFNFLDMSVRDNHKMLPIHINQKVKDHPLKLSNNITTELSSLLKNSPVLLVFVRGTWCPFCRLHMGRLRNWVNKIKDKQNVTVIVVSSEPIDVVREWLSENKMPYLYASDQNYELADQFGVRVEDNSFFQGSTFLINTDMTVKLAYTGKRTQANFDAMEYAVSSLGTDQVAA